MSWNTAALAAAALAFAAPEAFAQAKSPVLVSGLEESAARSLAAHLPPREAPSSLFDAERLADEAAAIARDWLRAEGWYQASVEPSATDPPPQARIAVSPGPRFLYSQPRIAFSGAALPDAVRVQAEQALSAIPAGAPARSGPILAAEAEIAALLRARGYPDAAPGPRRVIVDHATSRVSVVFAFEIGAEVRLGAVQVAPEGALRPETVARATPWKPGDAYDPARLASLRREFAATGAFASVTTELAPEPNERGERDVLLRLERARPRTLDIGVGWSTTEGPGLDLSWSLRNATRRADTVTLSAKAAEERQALEIAQLRPGALGPGRALQLSAGYVRDASEPFERNGVYVSRAVTAARRAQTAMSYGVTAAADFYSAAAGVENAYVLSGFVDVRRDTADAPLDPRRGLVLETRIEPAVSAGDATTVFARATAQARGYWSPRTAASAAEDRLTLAARIRTGWVEPIFGDEADLPLDRLFYAGGGGSVRGYGFNSIRPETDGSTTTPPGGRALLETSAESRFRFGRRFGAVAFLDGGSAANTIGDFGDMRWGAGVGARYDLGFAPLRVDIAAPIDRRPGEPEVAFYVSLGQAF